MIGAVFHVETSWEPTTSVKGRIALPTLVIPSLQERYRHLNKANCTLYVTRLLIHHAAWSRCVYICLQWAIYGGIHERAGGIAKSVWFLRKQWTSSLAKESVQIRTPQLFLIHCLGEVRAALACTPVIVCQL